MVKTGLDSFEENWPEKLKGSRVGLLVHPASVNKRLQHAVNLFVKSKKFRLKALFGPQHGIYGDTQDNMIEWESFQDPLTKLPVFSLYGKTRKPEPSMLQDVDVIAIDLQDVGSRYYTFIWTLENCMQACMEMKKALIILDRPNPIGGHKIEGPVLEMSFKSFVGQRPLPIRHGMTIGEIGNYLKDEFYPNLDFYVIRMEGWRRDMWFDETDLPWVMPSPNMPTLDTATVYPGMCLLEGTNISEGRGTTRPFEIFGAPFIEPESLVRRLKIFKLPGVIFRPLYFKPTFQKYEGNICGGAQIHVTDRESFRPFKTGVAILKTLYELYPEQFKWRNPPYEYENIRMPIDILAGTDRLRKDIENGEKIEDMEDWWKEQSNQFNKVMRKKDMLYK
ncbi:MAG: exo-beta-N-acetylmuramidase NamZ family protein [Thermodesulfovibrionales bacterium]